MQPARRRARGLVIHYLRLGGIFVALFAIGLVLTFASPFFLTSQNILNILLQAATISIIAAGLTLVLIAAEIDLSIAALQAFTGSIAAIVIILHEVPVVFGIAVALAAGLLAGVVNGYATVFWKIPSFVVTLAMLGIAQGAALVMTSGRPISGFPDAYSIIGQGKVGPIPVPVIIAAGVYIVLHLVLTRTRFGIELFAVGGGRAAASLAGIRTGRVIITVFLISGFLAGLAGVILSSRLDTGTGNLGVGDLLDAVAAVVIGGTSLMGGIGSVIGTLGGVLIITTIRNGLVLLNVQAFWQQIAVGAIIIGAVLIDQVAKGQLGPRDILPGFKRR